MCHNFHIRGNSCLFFCEKKTSTMGKKQPTKSTPTRSSIRKKKRHKEARKNGDCHTNEKKGK